MNRREFLRNASVAGAAVVAAPLVAMAAGDWPLSCKHKGGMVYGRPQREGMSHRARPCNYDDIVRGAYDGYKMFWT